MADLRAMSRLRRALGAAVVAATLALPAAGAAFELMMVERDGCSYCKRWHAEIGPAYPRTAEGAAAPLRRVDLGDGIPDDVTLSGRVPVFTPTFVLLDEGREAGRIEGYAGDEFFWVLLSAMLERAGWDAP